MLKDVGMAVPKTTETGCRDGSVQATGVPIERLDDVLYMYQPQTQNWAHLKNVQHKCVQPAWGWLVPVLR